MPNRCHDREPTTLQVNSCSARESSSSKIPPKSQACFPIHFMENGRRSFYTRSWVILKEDMSVITLKFQESVDVEKARMVE